MVTCFPSRRSLTARAVGHCLARVSPRTTRRSWKVGVSLTGILISLLTPLVATAEWNHARPAYRVIDSNHWHVGPTSIYWIDNRSVLFVGGSNATPRTGNWYDDINPDKLDLLLWDTVAGSVRSLSKVLPLAPFCYRDGEIEYSVGTENGQVIMKRGRIGEEVEMRVPALPARQVVPVRPTGWTRDRVNCFGFVLFDLPRGIDAPLLDGHGFLGWKDFNRQSFPKDSLEPLRYYKDLGSPPIAVNIEARDFNKGVLFSDTFYSEWANRYVIPGVRKWNSNYRGMLPKDEPYTIRLLEPGTGDVTTLYAWYDRAVGTYKHFYSRVGLIVASSEVSGYGPGGAGLYRVVGKGYEKIISGVPGEGALSPDGCRLAITLQHPEPKKGYGPTYMKAIELCQRD